METIENIKALEGVLPDSCIRLLFAEGCISYGGADKIGSSSLDTSLTSEIYDVRAIPLPRSDQNVKDLLKMVGASKVRIDDPLFPGRMYIARLSEKINFPEWIYGYANPKSTTGRDDVHVRLLADGVSAFDTIPRGYNGDLWVVINPKSFSVHTPQGLSLNQIRVFTKDCRIRSKDELESVMNEEKLLFYSNGDPVNKRLDDYIEDDGSMLLPVDMESSVVGYMARPTKSILDMSQVRTVEPEDFFIPIKKPKDGMIFLQKDSFYILSTGLRSRIPPAFAAEMRPIDDRLGEVRVHYAGYLDDGFGNSDGANLTLEVRPYEDTYIQAGQLFSRIVYERMAKPAERSYAEKMNANYRNQVGPKLAKHFKDF